MSDPQNHNSRNERLASRYGMILFIPYLILYGGFVWMNAFKSAWMATPVLGGVNLAVIYGLGLIVAAFVLALVYMALCRAGEKTK